MGYLCKASAFFILMLMFCSDYCMRYNNNALVKWWISAFACNWIWMCIWHSANTQYGKYANVHRNWQWTRQRKCWTSHDDIGIVLLFSFDTRKKSPFLYGIQIECLGHSLYSWASICDSFLTVASFSQLESICCSFEWQPWICKHFNLTSSMPFNGCPHIFCFSF